jgi:hypothetical protein
VVVAAVADMAVETIEGDMVIDQVVVTSKF